MKKLSIIFLMLLFLVMSTGIALSEPNKDAHINFVKAYSKDNLTLEIDMANIIFHKLDNKIALEFVSRLIDIQSHKIVISRLYVVPDLSKFRVLEYTIIDSEKKIVTDSSTKVQDWKTYTNDSIVAQCVNFIINNKKSDE